MTQTDQQIWVAWAGWMLLVPWDWRPLRIEGEWQRGAMMLGDAEAPAVQIKWWRPEEKKFDAERWLKKRLKKVRAPVKQDEGAPHPKGFEHCVWAPESKDGRAFWYGYASEAGLMLEAVLNTNLHKRIQRRIIAKVLPTLRACGREEETRWSIYGASFTAPPEYSLAGRRLQLGDVTLALKAPKGRKLILRQVYPAQQALQRRSLENWMEMTLFKEYRKYKPDGDAKPWTIELNDREYKGVIKSGRKRIAWPFGFIMSRQTICCAINDPKLDRLMFVYHDDPTDAHEIVLQTALEGMHWAIRGF